MGGKAWSSEEDAKLRKCFERGDVVARLAEQFPGRTYDGIKAHASRLGIIRADYRSWTSDEDTILREIWTTPRSIKDGMHRLERRSYDAAKIRANRLGLGKKAPPEKGTRSWVLRSIKTLLANGVCMSMKEIASATGADRGSIQDVLANHHGKTFYVAGWERVDANHPVMKWALGAGPDAPKPAAKTPQEYWKGYQDRKRIKRGLTNPFAIAAGLVKPTKASTGRVYIHLHDDELEAAA